MRVREERFGDGKEWVLHGNSVGGTERSLPGRSKQVYTAIDACELRSSPLWLASTEGACTWRRNSSGYVLATVLFTFPVVMTNLPDALEGLILTPSSRLQSIMTGKSQKQLVT